MKNYIAGLEKYYIFLTLADELKFYLSSLI